MVTRSAVDGCRPNWRKAACLLSLGVSLQSMTGAGTPDSGEDKSQYNLFHPVPRSALREFSADRPDKTDSPLTVDAGHFQVEMDWVTLIEDRHNSEREDRNRRSFEIAPMNLKVGVFNNMDVQLVVSPFRSERVDVGHGQSVERTTGFGDVTPRVKLNLVGNDGGPFALAVMPFVKLPTSSRGLGNSAVEGGLKVPYAIDIPGWEVGFQTEVDIMRDGSGNGNHAEWIQSISVGRPIYGRWSFYVEWFSNVSLEQGAGAVQTFDTWVTYQWGPNLRLEAGVYLGVTRAAEDYHPFLGMTWRY